MHQNLVKESFDFVLPLVREYGKIIAEAEDYDVKLKPVSMDHVTKYDLMIEEVLTKRLKDRYPKHKFIGEEESEENGIAELTSDPTWIIDPIDGTSNFVKHLKLSAISVGLVINKVQEMGIVYNPFLDECFTAIRGQGAFLNGQRIATSGVKEMAKSIFNYELSLAVAEKYTDMYMYRLKHIIRKILGIRSLGCATLGLCYVADGRLDAYQCDGLYPWDAAAGVLIVREAGGYVCDSNGKEFDLMNPNYLATSTKELSDQYMAAEREADIEMSNNKK